MKSSALFFDRRSHIFNCVAFTVFGTDFTLPRTANSLSDELPHFVLNTGVTGHDRTQRKQCDAGSAFYRRNLRFLRRKQHAHVIADTAVNKSVVSLSQ